MIPMSAGAGKARSPASLPSRFYKGGRAAVGPGKDGMRVRQVIGRRCEGISIKPSGIRLADTLPVSEAPVELVSAVDDGR